MRTLFLLRHAQAMPGDGRNDAERKLTPNGIGDATALGREMKKKDYRPAIALCSTATRTRQTLDAIMDSFGSIPALYLPQIYEDGPNEILGAIQDCDDTAKAVMVIGHNPSIHALAVMLAKEDSPALMNRLAAGYKPATLCVLSCPCEEWKKIQPKANILTDFLETIDYNAPSTPARWT